MPGACVRDGTGLFTCMEWGDELRCYVHKNDDIRWREESMVRYLGSWLITAVCMIKRMDVYRCTVYLPPPLRLRGFCAFPPFSLPPPLLHHHYNVSYIINNLSCSEKMLPLRGRGLRLGGLCHSKNLSPVLTKHDLKGERMRIRVQQYSTSGSGGQPASKCVLTPA